MRKVATPEIKKATARSAIASLINVDSPSLQTGGDPEPAGDGIAREEATAEVAEIIRVRGTVQGVGFRPTVYRVATAWNLRGTVCNDGQGVVIQVVGQAPAIAGFVQQLSAECPPLARIESIERDRLVDSRLSIQGFTIISSVTNTIRTDITPDAATCPACKADLFDPHSRWYRYPFTNCTHCGPRLSIVRAIPYDRPQTSMAAFHMCPACQREYEEVRDRRFHAQPIACPNCGPQIWLEQADGQMLSSPPQDDIEQVCRLLEQGEILAIKGLGGFHLACDATHEPTVQRLRSRKHRDHKPLALMARDLAMVEQYCWVSEAERTLLESPAAPIVLLRRRKDRQASSFNPLERQDRPLAASVAPGLNWLGFMLPYTPLHHLILQEMDHPIVLTSGNQADEPQCISNQAARERLNQLATYYLFHDREIVNRVDDSVVRMVGDRLQILRRARGYAPAPVRLPAGFEVAPPILAMGSELKNTVCLLREGQAILSQHLGDLENAAAYDAYQHTLNLYLNLFEHHPSAIAIDQHPEYLSSKLGKELAIANALTLHSIQHHHAHVAACMVDNQLPLDTPPVLGIALDGLGYGEDGTLWGGEFLLADYYHSQRLAHLQPVAMLGGQQAVYQPWRNTYAHLMSSFSWDTLWQEYSNLELLQTLERKPRSLLNQLLATGIQSPLASSCGRLFDAVAAALGLYRERCSYEGQAAIALETLAETFLASVPPESLASIAPYPFTYTPPILGAVPMWQALLQDLRAGVALPEIAARFHLGLAQAIAGLAQTLQTEYAFTHIVLTGGVFQNSLLLQQVSQRLTAQGFTVLTHSRVPANDGGLALGQAAIAAARSIQSSHSR